jgi:hypothetical protein
MAALAPVTIATAPPPSAGGGAPAAPPPQAQGAAGPSVPVATVQAAPPVQAPPPPLPQGPPEAQAPSALQIQSVLTSVQYELDDLPQSAPNAPNTVALEAQLGALQSALLQVQTGEVDSAAGIFSGLLLNAFG